MPELTKDDILTITRNHYTSGNSFTIKDAKDCWLNIYNVVINKTWCAFLKELIDLANDLSDEGTRHAK